MTFASGAPIRVRGVDNLQKRLDALAAAGKRREMMERLGLAARDEAKRLVPRKTGNLGRTIRTEGATERSVRVVAGGTREVGYAAYVEKGTGPHVIVPRKARVLAWGGARRLSGNLRSGASPEFFAMKVNHPGTKAQPYLVPGAQRAMSRGGLKESVIEIWNEAA
jgi:hypothetical protein